MKNNMNLTSLFTMLLAVALIAAPASATVLTYTDLASWQAAVASSSVEDFEGATADTDFTFTPISSPNGGLLLSAVEESTFTNNMLIDVVPLITSNGEINGDAVLSMRYLSHVSDPADSVTVTLPAGLSAFGFEWKNYDSQADSAEISFAGTNGQAGPVFTPGTGFYGIVDTDPGATITSFTITATQGPGTGSSTFMTIDDVRYGTAIPEPTGLALLGLAGIALAGLRRK